MGLEQGKHAAPRNMGRRQLGARIYDVLRDESERIGIFGHGYTYGGHPVCAAVACEALRIYEEEKLIARAAARGRRLISDAEIDAGGEIFASSLDELAGSLRSRNLLS
jgi:4-aminobutyrate--pyruvate transaminase